jgi:hypothetical protein
MVSRERSRRCSRCVQAKTTDALKARVDFRVDRERIDFENLADLKFFDDGGVTQETSE